jgi:hypothetical protein
MSSAATVAKKSSSKKAPKVLGEYHTEAPSVYEKKQEEEKKKSSKKKAPEPEPEPEEEDEGYETAAAEEVEKPKRGANKLSDKHKVALYFGVWLLKELKSQDLLTSEKDPRDILKDLLPILNNEDEAAQSKYFIDFEKTLKTENSKRAIAKELRDKKKAEKEAEKMRKAAEKAQRDAEKREAAAAKKEKAAAERKPRTKKEKAIADVDGAAPAEPKKRGGNKKKSVVSVEEPAAAPPAEVEVMTEEVSPDEFETVKHKGVEYKRHIHTNIVYLENNDEYEEVGVYTGKKILFNEHSDAEESEYEE